MKKKSYLILLFIFLLTATNVGMIGKAITGDTVTGEATSSLGLNISVIAYFPTLTIWFPQNATYITNNSFPMHFSENNAQKIWYNLDDSENTIITSSVYLNLSQGSHTLYLYANSSFGNITAKNVTFFINSTSLSFSYSEYEGSYKGKSTYFENLSTSELQNISNFILEHTSYGKIFFDEIINLTDFSGSIIDLDSYTNISSNRIEINTSALPNFNKSATLRFYNLTFTNPRIAMGGVVCPSTICVKQSYSGGILVFNVTHFTIYSAEETPVGESSTTSISGGGGTIRSFSLDIENIIISLKQGEIKKQEIKIKNTGNWKSSISLEAELQNFLKISETSFDLNREESKTIILNFTAREDTIPGLYQGKLIVKADGIEKEVSIAIEIESKKPLFDVKLEIPRKFLYILPGEKIMVDITLYNLGEIGKVAVGANYIIKDENDNIIINEQENLTIETYSPGRFTKTFKLPLDIFRKHTIRSY